MAFETFYFNDEDFTQEKIQDFIEKINKGKEKPEIEHAKKEEIVKVLNDKTFEEVVYGEKDVIVMFHAENCDICKKVKRKKHLIS